MCSVTVFARVEICLLLVRAGDAPRSSGYRIFMRGRPVPKFPGANCRRLLDARARPAAASTSALACDRLARPIQPETPSYPKCAERHRELTRCRDALHTLENHRAARRKLRAACPPASDACTRAP